MTNDKSGKCYSIKKIMKWGNYYLNNTNYDTENGVHQ